MFKSFAAAAVMVSMVSWAGPMSAAHAQGVIANAPDPFVHKGVAVKFPKDAGGFKRIKVTEFNAEGSDVGVGYTAGDIPGEMTVYLYPVRDASCQQEFNGAKSAVLQRKAKLVKKAPDLALEGFAGATQMSAQFTVKKNGYGSNHPKLVSYLWLGCMADGKWLAKYRGSFHASHEDQIDGVAQRLMSAIDWSALTTAQP